MISEVGPNVTADGEEFFQTDSALEARRKKEAKIAATGENGNPLNMSSKILDLQLILGQKNFIYVAESGFIAKKLDLETGKASKVFRGHSGPVTCVFIAYNSALEDEFVFTGSWDKSIRKWSAKTKDCLQVLEGHVDFVKCLLMLSPTILVSGSADSTMRVWDLNTGKTIRILKDHSRSVEALCLSDCGSYLFSASSDSTINKYSLVDFSLLGQMIGHATSIYMIQFFDDMLYSVSADKTCKRWNTETGICDMTIESADFLKSVAVWRGFVIVSGREEDIHVWDPTSETLVHTFRGHFDEVSTLKINYETSTLYSGGLDCTVRSWDLHEIIRNPSPLEKKDKEAVVEVEVEKPIAEGQEMTAEEEAELAELMSDD